MMWRQVDKWKSPDVVNTDIKAQNFQIFHLEECVVEKSYRTEIE